MNNKDSYNLCDKKEYMSFITERCCGSCNVLPGDYDYYIDNFDFYHVAMWVDKNFYYIINHRLDGPTTLTKNKYVHDFWIYGEPFSEEEYWKHPDVVRYQYLKEHPELEAFV